MKNQQGFTLPSVLSMMIAVSIIGTVGLQVILNNFAITSRNIQSQQAFNIAEAGVNYYLWHLSHNSTDFKDGQTTPLTPDPELGFGPYQHDYINDNTEKTGTYTLWINPQGNGSSVVTVRSIGQVDGSNATRTVDAKIGASSFASYGLVSDSAFWFGNTETANGPVHSNQGIRQDGPNTADVTSANATYVPPYSLGGCYGSNCSRDGVWCDPSVTSPINCNTRSKSDWRYPVPLVDFNQVSTSLCTMKKVAFGDDPSTQSLATQTNACIQTPTNRTGAYLPQRSSYGSYNLTRGYLIELNADGTYNLFNVNGENDQKTSYDSALSRSPIANNIAIPPSGVIFAEDNVWVRSNPTFKGRVTIAAGRLATSYNANIVMADDILYSTKNGEDAIGLVAESQVLLAPYAPPSSGSFNFEVDAATLSESDSVMYPFVYRTNQNRCTRGWVNNDQQFKFYGSVATRQSWTWTIFGGSCGDRKYSYSQGSYWSGILNNTTEYDYNLLYAPPPSFPITGGYNILSWREVLVRP